MKKRWVALILVLVFVGALLSGCNGSGSQSGDSSSPSSDSVLPSGDSAAPGGDAAANDRPADYDTKTHINIGMPRPISGMYEVFEQTVFGPIWRMWRDEINADGGIYVAEYGKKLLLDIDVQDDMSDLDTVVRLSEKFMTEDHKDFVFPSCSTAILFAQAAVTNQHGYMLFSAEGGAAELGTLADKFPMFFCTANHSVTQVPAMVDIFIEQGVKSVYISFLNDLYGVEYSGAAVPALAAAGIEVKGIRSIPFEMEDFTPILLEAQASGADAYIQLAYPDQNFPAVGQAMAIGYNPDVMLMGPGANMDALLWSFGDAANGIMGFGGWNAKSTPAAAEYVDKIHAYDPSVGIDWWGMICYYTMLQIWQQAVEGAGTLDNAAVAAYMHANRFETIMGTVWFDGNEFAAECFLGNIGQWQNGVYEVIDVTPGRRTADPIVPKPPWPAP